MQNKRIGYLDIAKGIAILAVIVGHIDNKVIQSIIFTFHMPIFFIISGYFCNSKLELKKILKRLILPYIITVCFIIIGQIIINFAVGNKLFSNCLYWLLCGMLGYGAGDFQIGAIWFLLALFWAKIIFSCILKIDKEYIRVICVALLIIIGMLIKNYIFSFSVGLVCVGWLYVGYIFKNKEIYEKEVNFFIYLIMLVFIIFCMFVEYFNAKMTVVNNTYPNGVIDVFGGIIGSFLIIKFSKFLEKKKYTSRFLTFYGKNSLIILCIHILELNLLGLDCIFRNILILILIKLILITILCKFIIIKDKKRLYFLPIIIFIIYGIFQCYKNTYKISCLGDSITYGLGGDSWTIRLKDLTGASFVYNYGVSGSTIQEMSNDEGFIDRYQYINKYSDYIVVWGGTNDFIWTNTDIKSFEEAYEKLIKLILEKYPNSKILGITPLKFEYGKELKGMYTTKWNQKNSANGYVLKDYRDAEVRVLEKYNIEILDLYNDDYMFPENEEWSNLYFNSDFDKLHPNTDGNFNVIAPKIAEKLN